MKNAFFAFCLCAITGAFYSCTTVTTFDSPNNVSNMKSTLYLKDGTIHQGLLTINTDNTKNSTVRLRSENSSNNRKFKLKQVKGYSIGADQYFMKEIDNNTITIEKGNSLISQLMTKKQYYFMKRLTEEDSRIHLYENDRIVAAKEGSNTIGKRVIEYFIQLPGDSNTVYALDDNKLLPNFDEKMSAIVKDCPALAQKVAQRQPGYYYSSMNLPILSQKVTLGASMHDNNVSVLLNIIKEYNQCQ